MNRTDFDTLVAACDRQPVLQWDALFLCLNWLPECTYVRDRHRRITGSRWDYATPSEIIYKASRSAFCLCASRFEDPRSQLAIWVAATGCPVLVGKEFISRCPFGIPVENRLRTIPSDPFSDPEALPEAIDRALATPRHTVRECAMRVFKERACFEAGPDLADPAFLQVDEWVRDWDRSMPWAWNKESTLPPFGAV